MFGFQLQGSVSWALMMGRKTFAQAIISYRLRDVG